MNHHEFVVSILKHHFMDQEFFGIEIGTAEAMLTKTLLMEFPNLHKIYTIDPYIHNPNSEFEAARPQEWHNDRHEQAKQALSIYGTRALILPVKSDEAVSLTPDSVDFVWIDGDHLIAQIEKDIKNYYPKVIRGGIFGGHDYPQASIALANVLPNVKVITGEDLCWYIIKE